MGLLKIDEAHFNDPALIRMNHEKMIVSADHLLSLINDVLQMSKLEDGTVVFAHEPICLAEMTQDIVTIVIGRAVDAGIVWDYEKGKAVIPYPYPRWTRADTLSSGKKSALDIVIVLGGRQPRPKGTGFGRPGGRCQATPPSSSSSPDPIFARWKVRRSFSGAEIVSGEADEAGGLSPVNEENEAGRGFRPEKPYLPLSIEGIRWKTYRNQRNDS